MVSSEPACLKDQWEDENSGFLKQISSCSCELISALVHVCNLSLPPRALKQSFGCGRNQLEVANM